MSIVKINGQSYSGSNIVVANGKVIIDGKDVTPDAKQINVYVEGDIVELKADYCEKISVIGSVKNVSTTSGDVDVAGNIEGNISTMSGDVECFNVSGSISTMSGDISHNRKCE